MPIVYSAAKHLADPDAIFKGIKAWGKTKRRLRGAGKAKGFLATGGHRSRAGGSVIIAT
jgi:hypothetical protein